MSWEIISGDGDDKLSVIELIDDDKAWQRTLYTAAERELGMAGSRGGVARERSKSVRSTIHVVSAAGRASSWAHRHMKQSGNARRCASSAARRREYMGRASYGRYRKEILFGVIVETRGCVMAATWREAKEIVSSTALLAGQRDEGGAHRERIRKWPTWPSGQAALLLKKAAHGGAMSAEV